MSAVDLNLHRQVALALLVEKCRELVGTMDQQMVELVVECLHLPQHRQSLHRDTNREVCRFVAPASDTLRITQYRREIRTSVLPMKCVATMATFPKSIRRIRRLQKKKLL